MPGQFVPIVGSGFDQIAAQGAGWAGYNQRQDSENMNRLASAEAAQNQWFSRLAQMQEQENQRRDQADALAGQTAQKMQADELERQRYAAQTAEARRQFDLGAGLRDKEQKLREDEFQFKKDSTQDTLDKQREFVFDLGETMAPHVKEAGEAQAKAEKEANAALTAYNAGGPEWESKLPGSRWNPAKNELEQIQFGKPVPWTKPEEQKIAQQAAQDMAERKSAYFIAAQAHKDAAARWQHLSTQFGNDLVPVQDADGKWGLRAPRWKKSFFASEVAKAKEKLPPFIPQEDANMTGPPLSVGGGITFGRTPGPSGPTVMFRPPGDTGTMPETDTTPPPSAPPVPSMPFTPRPTSTTAAPFTGGMWPAPPPPTDPAPAPVAPQPTPPQLGFVPNPTEWIPSFRRANIPPGRVRVMAPRGKRGTIPIDQLEVALANGYKLAPLND